MSSGRQVTLTKACDACIRAKRKCSRALPSCQRCTERRISCTYKNEPLSNPQPAAAASASQSGGGYSQIVPAHGGHFRQLGFPATAMHTTRLIFSVSNPSPFGEMQFRPPDIMLTLDESTIRYLEDRIRSLPAAFARTGGTLFIHPRLYQDGLPPLLQNTLALSTLLTNSRDGNGDNINNAVSEVSHLLLQSIPSTDTFASKLAFVQSLILLQIMTLFSPTMTQILREQAENRVPLLRTWIRKLYDSAPPHLPASMSSYQAWILAESCRRTIHVAHIVLGLHTLLTQGCFILTPFVQALPLERNGHLWEDELMIPAQQGFILDTEEKTESSRGTSLISFRELKDLWENGEIKRPRLFEEMLLVVCKGVDNVKLEST